jgi:ATP-dependent RNA helicase DHX29
MAKKKKTPLNPARGFATTSTPSKPRFENLEKLKQPEKDVKVNEKSSPTDKRIDAEGTSKSSSDKELHELSPEELGAQLERNELQLMVEKYTPKVQRDVQRQLSKVHTDRRILRAQATSINSSQWLPDELVLEIIDLARKETAADANTPRHDPRTKPLSEDEMVIRCWTLFQTLSRLHVALEDIRRVIKSLLSRSVPADGDDYVWGLKEALDLLALDEEGSLPPYGGQNKYLTVSREDTSSASNSRPASAGRSPAHSPQRSESSRPASPGSRDHRAMDPSNLKSSTPELASTIASGFDVSDLDSDLEPDELVSEYLSIKARLYEVNPDLLENESRSKKSKSNGIGRLLPPGVRKLQNKMNQITSDPLFDQYLADVQWPAKRNEIAQQTALDRRLEALKVTPQGQEAASAATDDTPRSESPAANTNNQQSSAADSARESDNDEEVFGSMFTPPSEEAPSSNAGPTLKPATTTKLRDFGHVTGMHPRRILEDACRARDSSAKLSFQLVSPTAYSCRHSVTVSWSKSQEKLGNDCHPSVSIAQRTSPNNSSVVSTMTFVMTTVSTPSTQQSEAYAATAALFYIFSASPNESKVSLKLSPAWRDLWGEFAEHRKEQEYAADRESLKMLRGIVHEQLQSEEDDGVVLSAAFRGRSKGNTPSGSREPGERSRVPPEPQHLANLWLAKISTMSYQRMLPQRTALPMFGFREAALSAIDKNQVLILCGETGCGKSTQLPAYVLEHELSQGRDCKIYCTQPRRISAISLAQRVSEELGESRNDLGTSRSLVGYAIRLETKVGASTKLVYATVGIVLRMLESPNGLNDITHLIIDEVHERSIDTDFLLIVLRGLMLQRPELKVVLMSATVDASRFSKYLGNAPIVNVPGRTFPVRSLFLEDAIEFTHYVNQNAMRTQDVEIDADTEVSSSNREKMLARLGGYSAKTRAILSEYDEYRIDSELIVKLIERIFIDPTYAAFTKAVLVFLPGIAEIRELNDMLVSHPAFNHNCLVYPLHSSIASEEQQAAFLVPPPGVRKIVLATNIAETGITIPDVTCVIDTGKHKEMRYDERRQLSRLLVSFISKANAKQRRGRAGRVQEGLCFHLFTKYRHDEQMADQQTPEMLRLSLQDLVMRVKICKLGDIEQTLSQALDPPSSRNIRRAIDSLIEVGAFTTSQDLTTLGSQLAKLPLDAILGKLCLFSAVFSCLDMGLTIAAILSSKSPFVTPFGQRQAADNARLSFAKSDSDLLTAYNAYICWRRVLQDPAQNIFAYCRKNFLSHQNLSAIEDLKGQLLTAMVDTGLVPRSALDRSATSNRGRRTQRLVEIPADLDVNSTNPVVTTTVIAVSFYPKILLRDGKAWRNISNSQSVSLHPSSINKSSNPTTGAAIKFLSYYSLMQSTSGAKTYNALSTTPVPDLALLLLAGDAEWRIHAGVVVLDGNRLRFKVGDYRTAMALKTIRKRLEEYVEGKLEEPGRPVRAGLERWLGIWDKIVSVGVVKEGQKP